MSVARAAPCVGGCQHGLLLPSPPASLWPPAQPNGAWRRPFSPRLEPSGLTLVGEQLGILLVGGESSQLSQGRRLRCQWTWVTGRSPPLPTRCKELLYTIGQRGDKELRGRPPAGRQSGHNGVELPSEPDSGSAGSSSCAITTTSPMGACIEVVELKEISNFNSWALCVRAILGPWRAPEERGEGAQNRHFEGSVDGRGLGL